MWIRITCTLEPLVDYDSIRVQSSYVVVETTNMNKCVCSSVRHGIKGVGLQLCELAPDYWQIIQYAHPTCALLVFYLVHITANTQYRKRHRLQITQIYCDHRTFMPVHFP